MRSVYTSRTTKGRKTNVTTRLTTRTSANRLSTAA
jgi:hypothetical protein